MEDDCAVTISIDGASMEFVPFPLHQGPIKNTKSNRILNLSACILYRK
jgi:hypothetical protein